jgi:nicotinamide phosphoribosyltransferase
MYFPNAKHPPIKEHNMVLLTDSYKTRHDPQYPPGTQYVYSYEESRAGAKYPATPCMGLQYYLLKYMAGKVFTLSDVDEAYEMLALHFEDDGVKQEKTKWLRLFDAYGGALPLQIKAVPEGTLVPTGNVLSTVCNTDPAFHWVTNYYETLKMLTWYPSTVSAQAMVCRMHLIRAWEKTGSPNTRWLLRRRLHNFGGRGGESVESGAIADLGLAGSDFEGSDTAWALALARNYYDAECSMYSVPASEHSTMMSWGREHEIDAFRNMLDLYPTGLVSVVSDQYDIFHACRELWGTQLKDRVMQRDGIVVIRPDSGDPCVTVLRCLEILGEKFGTSINERGYKVLDPHVRLIQGDGIDPQAVYDILDVMEAGRWSVDNIVFGSGGGLVQKINRDTQRMAIKCSYTVVNGQGRMVSKQPVGCDWKQSKDGILALVRDEQGRYQTVSYNPQATGDNLDTLLSDLHELQDRDELETVFMNGEVTRLYTLNEVRSNFQTSFDLLRQQGVLDGV